jgi:hypothetical protein
MWGIFWLAENLLAAQEGICSIELSSTTADLYSWDGSVLVLLWLVFCGIFMFQFPEAAAIFLTQGEKFLTCMWHLVGWN